MLLISIVKYVLFIKILLLIIISRVVIDDLNAINNGTLMEKNSKCYIDIVK